MRRRPDTERKHVILRAGDFDRLAALFPRAGPSTVIRHIISSTIDALEAERAERNLRELTDDERIQQIIRDTTFTDDELEPPSGGEPEIVGGVIREPS
jgi:hypothetical protein